MKKLFLLVLLVFLCSTANATTIRYNFIGTVTRISGAAAPAEVNDTFSGYVEYVYDLDLDPIIAAPNPEYRYTGSYLIDINGFTLWNDNYGYEGISEAHVPSPTSFFVVDEDPMLNEGVSGDQNGIDVVGIGLDLLSLIGFVNISDSMVTPLSFGMIGRIDSISVAPVPEPSTILLFSFGLLGFAGVSRKKQ